MNDFIISHRNDDIRDLALKAARYPDIDMPYAIQQINGWQRARHKLPLWAATDGIIYPPQVSMEQCSSEATAQYKQRLITDPTAPLGLFLDLTGGFGVDFSYMSRGFERAIYVERQQHLCDIARQNFKVLGLTNTEVVCGDGIALLPQIGPADCIYLDPARRDDQGSKTYAISDCTPDVVTLMPQLLAALRPGGTLLIKLSPMLDVTDTLRRLPNVAELHVVSVRNECKEILIKITHEATAPTMLVCVNDDNVFTCTAPPPAPPMGGEEILTPAMAVQRHSSPAQRHSSPPHRPSSHTTHNLTITPGLELFVPNASVMKAGCFAQLCQRYGLHAIDPNSHLYIRPADQTPSASKFTPPSEGTGEAPCRRFTILGVTTLNKKDLKATFRDLGITPKTPVNIACRNFPMTPQELRRRLRLPDGGDIYIFGTTANSQHILIICRKP